MSQEESIGKEERMTLANLMHEAGHPKPVLWEKSERQGGEDGGRGFLHSRDTCIPVADSY